MTALVLRDSSALSLGAGRGQANMALQGPVCWPSIAKSDRLPGSLAGRPISDSESGRLAECGPGWFVSQRRPGPRQPTSVSALGWLATATAIRPCQWRRLELSRTRPLGRASVTRSWSGARNMARRRGRRRGEPRAQVKALQWPRASDSGHVAAAKTAGRTTRGSRWPLSGARTG